MEAATCASCGMNSLLAQYFVIFPCPNCGKATVARCGRCKALGRSYECGECGFEGP
ncbi:MAG: zinc finger domain-containing protein [Candidatus Undinarchaeales archaeon]|nr:zinc finger domain-containing protein [Candidatus Undinarchaeales archaeon]MDP7491399.1 zinc finger domain-containing protein [Candidatus Undinarchaeales archaeon]